MYLTDQEYINVYGKDDTRRETRTSTRIPECRACRSDALSCLSIHAHSKRVEKQNREAVRRWRKRVQRINGGAK